MTLFADKFGVQERTLRAHNPIVVCAVQALVIATITWLVRPNAVMTRQSQMHVPQPCPIRVAVVSMLVVGGTYLAFTHLKT